jgi:ABC-type dipeptide/oligopeptide/nickel transport system ATPase component
VAATVRSIAKTHTRNHPSFSAEVEPPPEPKIVAEPEEEFPVELLQPGGILQELMDFTTHASTVNVPIFDLAAALTFVGSIIGQRVMTETGLRTNLYSIAVGGSGCGKDAALKAAASLAKRTRAHEIVGPTQLASAAGLLTVLKNRPICLCCIDEIGMLIQGTRRHGSHLADLVRHLTEAFSRTGSEISKDSYADASKNFVVPFHHLSLFGVSTPGPFWNSLTESDTVSGFLARILVVEWRGKGPKARRLCTFDPPQHLIDAVDALWAITPPPDPSRGNLEGATGPFKCVPAPFMIPKTPGAADMAEHFSDRYRILRDNEPSDSAVTSIYNRAAEHMHKVALIHATSMQGPEIIRGAVDEDSVEWACKFVGHWVDHLAREVGNRIAVNEFHAWQQKIIRAIADRCSPVRPGLTAREIMKFVRGLSKRTFDELITSMESAGDLARVEKPCGRGGKNCTLFCIAGGDAE